MNGINWHPKKPAEMWRPALDKIRRVRGVALFALGSALIGRIHDRVIQLEAKKLERQGYSREKARYRAAILVGPPLD